MEAVVVLLVPAIMEIASRYLNKPVDCETSEGFQPADSLLLLAYEADWAQLKLPPPVYKIDDEARKRRSGRKASACAVLKHRYQQALNAKDFKLANNLHRELKGFMNEETSSGDEDQVWSLDWSKVGTDTSPLKDCGTQVLSS